MKASLKKTCTAFLSIGIALLAGLILFSAAEYHLLKNRKNITMQIEKLSFEFSTLRDTIIHGLVSGRTESLGAMGREVESLNKSLAEVMDNQLIPREFRVGLADGVDLAGLSILLREVGGDLAGASNNSRLFESLRLFGERIERFQQLTTTHLARKVTLLQAMIIGALAVVVFIAGAALFLLHQKLAQPLVTLAQGIELLRAGKRARFTPELLEGEAGCIAREVERLSLDLRKHAQEAGKYLALFEEAELAAIILDGEGRVVRCNRGARGMLGIDAEEAVRGKGLDAILSGETTGAILEAARQGRALSTTHFQAGGKKLAAVLTGRSCQGKEVAGMLLFWESGETVTDMTPAVRASRLIVMGELATSLAHEVNDLANGLINSAELVADDLAGEAGRESTAAICGRIVEMGERLSSSARQLLAFHGERPAAPEPVHIEKTVEESLALLQHQLKADGIRVMTAIPEKLPPVKSCGSSLRHVLVNVLHNARQALNERYAGQQPEKRLEIRAELVTSSAGASVRTSVTDWGVGIAPDVLPKIFQPFFSTRPAGTGTGLGLSVSRELLTEAGGSLDVESVPRNYTRVRIDLPVFSG